MKTVEVAMEQEELDGILSVVARPLVDNEIGD